MDNLLEKRVLEKIKDALGRSTEILSFTPLAGDASSRRYYRAALAGGVSPRSLVIMELGETNLPLSSEELAVFKEPPRELPFLSLHRFLGRLGVRIPALYGHWVEDGIIVLEDLGDLSLWDWVQELSPAQTSVWYQRAIDQLLLLQILGTRARDPSCIAFQQRFDFRLYMWEFDHFMEYGLQNNPHKKPTRSERELLTGSFVRIARQLENQPPSLTHRDYHSWNLMIHNGEVVVIDFQDALLAPMQYDLASLLNDRETDRIVDRDMEPHLIDYYLRRRQEMGEAGVDRDEFLEVYLLSAIQRDLKVVGRFEYLDRIKGKPGYKKYLPPTLRRLKRNLLRLPYLEKILPVFSAFFEEMR